MLLLDEDDEVVPEEDDAVPDDELDELAVPEELDELDELDELVVPPPPLPPVAVDTSPPQATNAAPAELTAKSTPNHRTSKRMPVSSK